MKKPRPPAPLRDPTDALRIRSGQRALIICTARRIGLRDEQLHDLVENSCDFRTRAISELTVGEARRLIGTLMVMERGPKQSAVAPPAADPASDDLVKRAARRAGASA